MNNVSRDEVAKFSICETKFLCWNIGFDYYINKYELKIKKEYNDRFLFYLIDGDIRFEGDLKNKKHDRVILKNKIINKGKSIFRKIKGKLRDKFCEIWCEKGSSSIQVIQGGADVLLGEQYENFIEALKWIFEKYGQPEVSIPEVHYLIGSVVIVAALFIKTSNKLDELCNCIKLKELKNKKLDEFAKKSAILQRDIQKMKQFTMKKKS